MAETKKPVVKKKPKAKSVTKKTTRKAASAARKHPTTGRLSFRPVASDTPFLTFRITKETLYWLILSLAVLIFGLWLIKLQIQIQNIYDSIEANSNTLETIQMHPRSVR